MLVYVCMYVCIADVLLLGMACWATHSYHIIHLGRGGCMLMRIDRGVKKEGSGKYMTKTVRGVYSCYSCYSCYSFVVVIIVLTSCRRTNFIRLVFNHLGSQL